MRSIERRWPSGGGGGDGAGSLKVYQILSRVIEIRLDSIDLHINSIEFYPFEFTFYQVPRKSMKFNRIWRNLTENQYFDRTSLKIY